MKQTDWRNIATGVELPKEGYCDQPYTVITHDGNWLCVMTTGKGEEGDNDQHIVATISNDQGLTWSPLIEIEPPGPPESSWVTPLLAPSGRVYVFYTYNKDNLREVKTRYSWLHKRVDTLGEFAFKYSDDHGRTWSKQRFSIPVRHFQIDRMNPYEGEVRFFWSVCKPIVHKGAVYIGLAKVGSFGDGFMESSEGAFVRSDNLLRENDPARVQWETLPDGETGLRAPQSAVADEHNLVSLSDGSLYCIYRTTEGYSCHAYSRDDGHTWTPPEHTVYAPGGPKIKHPRAATFVRKFSNGHYVLWFHHHGMNWAPMLTSNNQFLPYADRNPVWLSGGRERNGYIHWSQPEIILYDEDPQTRISYPDFIEANGRYYITETQKSLARIHEIDASLLDGLWNQQDLRTIASAGLSFTLDASIEDEGAERNLLLPDLGDLCNGTGFSIDLWVDFAEISPRTIIDTRGTNGIGFALASTQSGTVQLVMNDGRTESSWSSDRNLLQPHSLHHVVITVDGGPKLISFVIDGRLCDGGSDRQFGFGRFNRDMRNVTGSCQIHIDSEMRKVVRSLRIYNRCLRTSEAVGHFRAGLQD
ncbi:hypothetical protein GC096_33155 [Paenibacillus sp. LMG 31461]|uniref:exo-alpha-sialidase n=1 Tax=Paenibacillus plantarum TaxID=2654975 RepID=A0ABX1XM10_9BACL|nr:exo-alpha-sialidase [Paenibacillus plantarum]NOU68869.1 hypothetical protein [Paenibacillus plantarum]